MFFLQTLFFVLLASSRLTSPRPSHQPSSLLPREYLCGYFYSSLSKALSKSDLHDIFAVQHSRVGPLPARHTRSFLYFLSLNSHNITEAFYFTSLHTANFPRTPSSTRALQVPVLYWLKGCVALITLQWPMWRRHPYTLPFPLHCSYRSISLFVPDNFCILLLFLIVAFTITYYYRVFHAFRF